MSSSTYVAARTISTQPLSRISPTMPASYPPPAVAQATWLNVKKRKSSTDTPVSTWSHSSSRPLDDLDTTPKSSSNTCTTTRITTDSYPGRLGGNSISKQQLRAVTT